MLGALPQWRLAATSFLSGPTCYIWCVAGRMSGTDALIIVGDVGLHVFRCRVDILETIIIVGERIGLIIVG